MKRFGYLIRKETPTDSCEAICAFDSYEMAVKHFSENIRRSGGNGVTIVEVLIRAHIVSGVPIVEETNDHRE